MPHDRPERKEVKMITPKANQLSALINAPTAKVPRKPRDPTEQTLTSPPHALDQTSYKIQTNFVLTDIKSSLILKDSYFSVKNIYL